MTTQINDTVDGDLSLSKAVYELPCGTKIRSCANNSIERANSARRNEALPEVPRQDCEQDEVDSERTFVLQSVCVSDSVHETHFGGRLFLPFS